MKFPRGGTDSLARGAFFLAIVMLAFAYGVGATQYDLFPVPQIKQAKVAAAQLIEESGASLPWYYQRSDQTSHVRTRGGMTPAPGLRLISGLGADEEGWVRIV